MASSHSPAPAMAFAGPHPSPRRACLAPALCQTRTACPCSPCCLPRPPVGVRRREMSGHGGCGTASKGQLCRALSGEKIGVKWLGWTIPPPLQGQARCSQRWADWCPARQAASWRRRTHCCARCPRRGPALTPTRPVPPPSGLSGHRSGIELCATQCVPPFSVVGISPLHSAGWATNGCLPGLTRPIRPY